MPHVRGLDYQKYRAQQDAYVRRKSLIRNMNPIALTLIRIVLLPVTLPIRIYQWVYRY